MFRHIYISNIYLFGICVFLLFCRQKKPQNGYSQCSSVMPISKNTKRVGKERKSDGEDERTRKQVNSTMYKAKCLASEGAGLCVWLHYYDLRLKPATHTWGH